MTGLGTKCTWPSTLLLPERPPKLVYLDLLHWVALAKANSGHRDGTQYGEALESSLEAVSAGRALFPISDAIYMEVAKIRQHRQRRDLREVIERLSSYRVITSRVVVANHEVEALLDRVVGPSPDPINTMDYLDWGVARAFGKVGGFRIKTIDTDEDVTEEVRSHYPGGPEAFDVILIKSELRLNRMSVEGPAADEEPGLREAGWDPRAAHEVAKRRAAQENEQVARLNEDPSWRGKRLRDVISAREVAIEINQMLFEGLAARNAGLDDVFDENDVEATRRALDSMPSFDVSVSLKTAYHRNPAHVWKPNHIQDIDALALTVPYCDVVVTDKDAASQLDRTGVAERLETTVLSRLSELARHL